MDYRGKLLPPLGNQIFKRVFLKDEAVSLVLAFDSYLSTLTTRKPTLA